jgi:hypothetical protein
MTPPNKPEWMELADADSAPSPKKVGRLIPAFIAAVAIAIVGVGAIATQISDEPPASANEQVVPGVSNTSPAAVQVAPEATNSVTQPKSAVSNPETPKKPSIATLPKNGGDDGEEGRGGRGEHEDDEDEGEDD